MKKIIALMFLGFLVSCGNASTENIVEAPEVTDIISEEVEEQALNPELFSEGIENVSWEGEYYSETNNFLELLGPAEDGAIDFLVSYDNVECSGFAGVAYLETPRAARYYDDTNSCIMHITNNSGSIYFESIDCGEYEDPICGGFSGVYE